MLCGSPPNPAPLIPLHLVVHRLGSLRQADGVQVEVAVEDDGAAAESSGQSAGEAAHKHVLTCGTTQTHNIVLPTAWTHGEAETWSCVDDPPVR